MGRAIMLEVIMVFTFQSGSTVIGLPQADTFPIPPEQLYAGLLQHLEGKPECSPKNLRNSMAFTNCMRHENTTIAEAQTDYVCRYYHVSHNLCTCCGRIAEYIEYGDVCTKFCVNTPGVKKCQDAIIEVPFNWGDDPPYKPCTKTSQTGGKRRKETTNNTNSIRIPTTTDTDTPTTISSMQNPAPMTTNISDIKIDIRNEAVGTPFPPRTPNCTGDCARIQETINQRIQTTSVQESSLRKVEDGDRIYFPGKVKSRSGNSHGPRPGRGA